MNPAFVPMPSKVVPGASRVRRRLLRCPVSDSRSRPLPLSMPKAPSGLRLTKGGMSADLFVAMLKQIMRRRRKPLFLVLDSLPAHKAKLVRDYVEAMQGKLKLYFLPGYAPELNPDEFVWSHMKRTGTAKRPWPKTICSEDASRQTSINIQNNRTLVRSFFNAPDVAYIADG